MEKGDFSQGKELGIYYKSKNREKVMKTWR